MPIYEYRCEPCETTFEALVRGGEGDSVATCPECGGGEVARQFSVPSAPQGGGARADSLPICGPSPSFGGCGAGGCGSGICAMD